MVREESQSNLDIVNQINYRHNNINKSLTSIFILYIYVMAAAGVYIILPGNHKSTYLFYSVVILGATLFSSLADNCKSTFSFNIFYSFSFFILFFTLGFRNFSGIDDNSYIRIFYEVAQHGWVARFQATTMEPGYLILNSFVSLFTDNYLYMQLLSSFIPLFLFFLAFKKYRSVINLPMAIFLLSTLLYFQILSVGLVRMFIAISIVFIAYYHIPRRNPKKYASLILLASMFHYSALFMLILTYFALNKGNLTKKTKRFVLIVFIVTPIAFVSISRFIVPFMGARYSLYSNIDNFSFNISDFSTIPILLLLVLYYKTIDKENTSYFKLFVTIFTLTSVLTFYGNMIPMGRLIFYTNSALFLAAPMVSKALNRDLGRFIFYSVLIFYSYLYVYWTQFALESHIPSLFPYQNIFFTIN